MAKTCESSVLVVDDDPTIRDLLSRFLEKAGFEAIHAEDGIDAVGKLRDTLPKVIISDLQMPRMSGYEFIGIVRQRFPTIPVIALSGNIPDEFSEEIKPDCWFEKDKLAWHELLHAVNYLSQSTPDHVSIPQVARMPIRARCDFGGYFDLTCPDCLRPFKTKTPRSNKLVEGDAVCTHCVARVPFLIESSALD